MKDCTTCKYYCKDYHREWGGALTPGNYCIRNGFSCRDAILVRVPCGNCSDYEKKEEETKEESGKDTKTDSVCDIRLKCYRYGKINGVCSEDLNDDSTEYVSINSKKVLYKTDVKEFRLPLSNSRTGKRYFLVVLTDDVKLYCPESEFNKL